MLRAVNRFPPLNNFLMRIAEYELLVKKVSMNGNSEPLKREHEEEGGEPNKRLCGDGLNVEIKKKEKWHKYAMLLAYNGRNYNGMQYNKNCTTVESELFKALSKVGIMQDDKMNEPFSIRFQRAARTDKTVSAARQIVSLLMPDGKCKPEDINEHLPQDIRVFSFKRATKRFDSKGNCISRTYSYLLPTHIFSQNPLESFLEIDYRITPAVIDKINEVLKIFIGSHNFHNYTSKMDAMDPRARRYIISFSCEEPFIKNKEFIIITVKGQSFILHQIRKMIGATIAVMRGIANTETINASFLLERIKIPLAPGTGLFLEKPHFDVYNKRYGNDGIHEGLTWEDVEEDIKKFRQEKIINSIVDTELEQQIMINWVAQLTDLSHEYFKPYKANQNQTSEGGEQDLQEQEQDEEQVFGDEELKERAGPRINE